MLPAAIMSTDQGAAAIYMQTDAAEVIEVVFHDAAGVDSDTSFLVSAFCQLRSLAVASPGDRWG